MNKKISGNKALIHIFHFCERLPLLFMLTLFALSACKDDFTTDGSRRLSFSVDTLRFDTVFSDVLTPTQTVKVYNHSGKDIQIERCQIDDGGQRFFQINLNGRSGTSFQNIGIPDGDSLYLFVQFIVPDGGKDSPTLIENHITFSYNSNTDQIVLSAYGQDVHRIEGDSITTDTVWENDKPYLVLKSLSICEGATLTIRQGARIFMHNDASITVNGKIICEGTPQEPVTFRGDRTDLITSKTSYDQLSNQWGGIHITGKSTGNILRSTIIRNGNYGILVDSAAIATNVYRLAIANSHIHNTDQYTLRTQCANLYAYNTLFTCGGNGCVVIEGGNALFNHCTIGNFTRGLGLYAYAAVLSDRTLYTDGEIRYPLNATFNNCIIYGSGRNEICYTMDEEADEVQIAFNHCLVKQDTTYKATRWNKFIRESTFNEDPNFFLVNTTDRLYDFRIDSTSVAAGKGSAEILNQYPECKTDIIGFPRLLFGLPDLGAYQSIPESIINQ